MGVDEDDSDEQDLSATEEQKIVVQWVLSRREDDHHGVLGIEEGSSDALILKGFVETGKDIHPVFNPDDGALTA